MQVLSEKRKETSDLSLKQMERLKESCLVFSLSLSATSRGAPLSCVPSETTQLAFPLSCFLFFCVCKGDERTRGSEPRSTEDDPSACRVLSWPWPAPCMHGRPSSPSFPGPVSFCFIDLCSGPDMARLSHHYGVRATGAHAPLALG